MKELIAKKLSEKINMDDLPEIIFDKSDYDNLMMDLANQCVERKNILSKSELLLFNSNTDLIVKLVGREFGLMI